MQTNIRFCLNVAGLATQTHGIGLKAHSRQSPAGDDEASSSDEKCSAEVGDQEDPNVPEDEENGDGIMVPADIELQQNLFDEEIDEDSSSATSSLEEYTGDVHALELAEQDELQESAEGAKPAGLASAASHTKLYHLSAEWKHLQTLGGLLTRIPPVIGAGLGRHPAGSFWSARYPGFPINTASWTEMRSPFRCLVLCMVRLVTLYLQEKPVDSESWQAQLAELKAFL